VLREAMALGTPAIASAIAGIPDALGDGCGVLVPPRDVGALVSAIRNLLADPEARLAIAQRARRRVEEHFDLHRNGLRLAGILETTRRRPRAPARASGPPVPREAIA
jgi:glycosyltransferase involved in cell wall biosynthesis